VSRLCRYYITRPLYWVFSRGQAQGSPARGEAAITGNFGNLDNLGRGVSEQEKESVGVALSCGVEGILRRQLSPRLLKLSRLAVTGFGGGCSARQTLRPPQRTLAGIPPKRSLVICTLPEARGSILRDCNHLWRVGHHTETQGHIKTPFAGKMLTPFSMAISSSSTRAAL
jgi:hypothetical protein